MSTFYEVFTRNVGPYYYYILLVVLLIVFAIVGYYGYVKYNKDGKSMFGFLTKPNKSNDTSGAENGTAVINLFHVDWCPHCKKAMPEWEAFKSKYQGKEVNGYTIECVDIDCTIESAEVTTIINKYKIESFPTVNMNKDDKVIEFDSKITSSSLDKFVNSML